MQKTFKLDLTFFELHILGHPTVRRYIHFTKLPIFIPQPRRIKRFSFNNELANIDLGLVCLCALVTNSSTEYSSHGLTSS